MAAGSAKRQAGSDTRWTSAVVVLSLLAIALSAFATFRRATTPWSVLPDYDYWPNIAGLLSVQGLHINLAALFNHNNEHIVVIPKLIYSANYLLTSGSNTAGVSTLERPETPRDKGRLFVGWRAVATLPDAMPLCALAYFPGQDQAVPLADCQDAISAEPAKP